MLDYLVIYESETGNTKKIATEIFSALPGMSKDLINLKERDADSLPEAHTYFVGFGIRRGTCSLELSNYLSSISGKSVALFGTCGVSDTPEYYSYLESAARIWLEDDNLYLGAFFCQGKMPLSVRKKYEDSLNTCLPEERPEIEMRIRNFDKAMIHPTPEDCKNAQAFTKDCLERLEKF